MSYSDEQIYLTTKYGDGVKLEEYNGQYSLVATRQGENEVNYIQWVFLSKWKNGEPVPGKKKLPMCVRLGDREMAIEVLKTILVKLEKGMGVEDDEGIPF